MAEVPVADAVEGAPETQAVSSSSAPPGEVANEVSENVEEAKKLVSPSASRSQGRRTRSRKKRSPQKAGTTSGRRERERARARRAMALSGTRFQGTEGPVKDTVAGPVIRDGKAIYSYGNYDPYYKHRFDRCAVVDPRIEALLQYCGTELFFDKVVLDVGCNSGFITFLVAALGARRVEGVDVDLTLISKALKHLRWLKQKGYKKMPELEDEGEKAWHDERYAVSCVQGRGHIPYHAKPLKAGALQAAIDKAKKIEKALPSMPTSTPKPDFPYNIEFRAANFQTSKLELKRKTNYDVVLLLKISLWIHMSYGDYGIAELFKKCHQLLRLGGLLVLEAQPWHKYFEKRKKHQPPSTKRNALEQLKLTPDYFTQLLGQQGFEMQMSIAPRRGVTDLRDPVLIFRKVALTQVESPPLMAEIYQDEQFLPPPFMAKKPKIPTVIPPRVGFLAKPGPPQGPGPADTPEATTDVSEATVPVTNLFGTVPVSSSSEAPTVEDSSSPATKRLKTEESQQAQASE